ncbi:uncharacterized protein PITG_14030 [Phytophthora infestans T30-4]|uniref:Uncharacterized protein n=1 Tax=Phytophthora infestans (strain T30-4) TaxID=403677 RepID=D0NNG7_PHYIT|nr:uncharacterized protein PITG_14030 [Phytophthora infestans T30-4]EEY62138.1 conserved hypothetical protein [Phytophthora infestans T30-4]|eukprot:XP_002899169.1 conserved hypothetical protein [Phytophthora infestans T30-4]
MCLLRKLCERPPAAPSGRGLREGTKDEWKIITGMKQVEGELILQLRGWVTVKPSRQATRALKDDILLAAEEHGVSSNDLRQMLHLVKTISYDHTKRSIHFHTFDRATARRFQDTQVPFKRAVYRLRNPHQPDTGSIWARQLGNDGVRTDTQREYVVDIFNVPRCTDVGRLNAYLQEHIKADIEFENLDVYYPESRSSVCE